MSLRHVLAQPGPALRKRLFLAVDAANPFLIPIGEEVVVDRQTNFRANLELRQTQEHVQGVRDPPIG